MALNVTKFSARVTNAHPCRPFRLIRWDRVDFASKLKDADRIEGYRPGGGLYDRTVVNVQLSDAGGAAGGGTVPAIMYFQHAVAVEAVEVPQGDWLKRSIA